MIRKKTQIGDNNIRGESYSVSYQNMYHTYTEYLLNSIENSMLLKFHQYRSRFLKVFCSQL